MICGSSGGSSDVDALTHSYVRLPVEKMTKLAREAVYMYNVHL